MSGGKLAGSGGKTAVDGVGRYASFYGPQGVGVDPRGSMVVTDTNCNSIRMISPADKRTINLC